jgi:hypothetical protein
VLAVKDSSFSLIWQAYMINQPYLTRLGAGVTTQLEGTIGIGPAPLLLRRARKSRQSVQADQ